MTSKHKKAKGGPILGTYEYVGDGLVAKRASVIGEDFRPRGRPTLPQETREGWGNRDKGDEQ